MNFDDISELTTGYDTLNTYEITGLGDWSTHDFYLTVRDENNTVMFSITSTGVSPAITCTYLSTTNTLTILYSKTNTNLLKGGKCYYADLKKVNGTELKQWDIRIDVIDGKTLIP